MIKKKQIFYFTFYCRGKTGQLKTVYKNENAAITSDMDISLSSGPIVNGSFVVGFQGKFLIFKLKVLCDFFSLFL